MTDVAERWTVRSTDLSTKRDIARLFSRHTSPRIITAAVTAAATARIIVGSWGLGDVAVIAFTLTFTGVLEWIVHLFILHSSPTSFVARRLGAGSSHRKHHLDPPDMRNLLLDGFDAGLFVVLLAALTSLWSLPLLALLGSPLLAGYLTALTATWAAFWHYEWTHLLVHTRYRPRTRFYRRLARNHRLHHYRNERHWLGVSSNVGDRILGTYPAEKTDVPLSDTARTLVD